MFFLSAIQYISIELSDSAEKYMEEAKLDIFFHLIGSQIIEPVGVTNYQPHRPLEDQIKPNRVINQSTSFGDYFRFNI